MIPETISVGPLGTNCYLLAGDTDADHLLIFDPGGDAEAILRRAAGRRIEAVLLTHGHFDHIGALDAFPDAPLYIGKMDAPMLSDPALSLASQFGQSAPHKKPDRTLCDGDDLYFRGFSEPVHVISVPGHTPGSCAYLTGGLLFSGDTLFARGCGRTDFPGGSDQAMADSLRRLLSLPEDTLVFPGHGPKTRIREERLFRAFFPEESAL